MSRRNVIVVYNVILYINNFTICSLIVWLHTHHHTPVADRRKQLNSTAALVAWDTAVMATCYPVFPLVRRVDAAFPHWVGGHVVGFGG